MAVTINGSTGVGYEDNIKHKLGTSDDLEIYHDGTNSILNNTTGHLDFHVDGTKKMRLSDGGDLQLDDSRKIELGSSQDLQIYHTSNENWIKAENGVTNFLLDNWIQFKNKADNETLFRAEPNGAFEAYYDNTQQLSTGTNGVWTPSNVALRVGSSGPVSSELFTVQRNSGQVAYFDHSGSDDHRVLAIRHRGASSSTYRSQIEFLDNDADAVGSVRSNGTSTGYNTSSDYRLKENEVLISDGITRLKTLKPYRFNFKKDPDTTVDGFFAHEVTAVPEAIAGEKDGKAMQGMDYGRITPLLTAALQEAITKIETLETEMNTLKTKVAALEAA